MLLIVLYYVNLIKWTASNEVDLNTYERFVAPEKPELSFESIINLAKDDRSSHGSDASSSFRNSNREPPLSSEADLLQPDQRNRLNQPNSNRSSVSPNRASNRKSSGEVSSKSDSSSSQPVHKEFSTNDVTSHDGATGDRSAENDSVERVPERPGDKPDDKQVSVPNYQLNAEASETDGELNLNRLNLNPTKATSLQSSSGRAVFNSILTADLSPDLFSDLSPDFAPDSSSDSSAAVETDRTSFRSSYYLGSGRRAQNAAALDEDSDRQEPKISSATVRSIQVLSSKHKVELKIDNQMVSRDNLFVRILLEVNSFGIP